MSVQRNPSPPRGETARGLAAGDRLPPTLEPTADRSIEAEQSVLGGLLLGGDASSIGLHAEDFQTADHRMIFAAALQAHRQHGSADVILVAQALGDQLEAVGGHAYINALAASVPSAVNLRHYAGIVREQATMRRVRALALDPSATPADFAALCVAPEGEASFSVCDMSRIEQAASDVAWLWRGYIPRGFVTALGGHGGAGKSYLALQLAVHVAADLPFLGQPVDQGRVLIYSAEDGADLVLARLRLICVQLGVPFETVQTWVQVIDASEGEPLFVERRIDGTTRGVCTSTFDRLRVYIEREKFDLVIVDNASDAYAANEIDRAQVRGFIRALRRLIGHAALLLLMHIAKTEARAGRLAGAEGYSGSTAWNNSVRSRLFLSQPEVGELLLEHQKCNLAPKRQPLALRWEEGDVIRVRDEGGFVAQAEARNDTRTILALIDEYAQRGEFTSTATTSRTHAHALLSRDAAFPQGLRPADVFELLRGAERKGLIVREVYRSPIDRKSRERWALTADGLALVNAATAATAATSEVTALGEVTAGACGDCGDFAARGCGGERAHTSRRAGRAGR